MAESGSNLQNLLKPFYQRASEAEVSLFIIWMLPAPAVSSTRRFLLRWGCERLAELEVSLARDKDCGNEEYLKRLSELQAELVCTKAELASEREKAKKYEVENEKLQYRITHLVHAVRENDQKLATK